MEVLSLIKNSLQQQQQQTTSDGPATPLSSSNPITKHFRLIRQTSCAGQEMVWKIYDAVRLADGKESSVFLFEKKVAEKLHKPRRREQVTELLRKEIRLLSSLRHPSVLRVIHPLQECHDSLAFATVPVHASLANLLGTHDKLPPNVAKELKDYSFLEVEIKVGIHQIAQALLHVHDSEHIVHMNVCPQNVVVTKRGMWKLTGFAFAECPTDRLGKSLPSCYPAHPWTPKHPKMAQPDLDYVAPEVQLSSGGAQATGASDIYSFSQLICAIYNNGKALIQAGHNVSNYSKQLGQISETFDEMQQHMPPELSEQIRTMLSEDARTRPTLYKFLEIKLFDDPVVRCMLMLDSVDTNDLLQKFDFFNKLPRTVPLFPPKLLLKSILPMMKEQLEHPEMLEFLLPSFVALAQHPSADEYKRLVQPDFIKIFSIQRPIQATVYLLENLHVILTQLTDDVIKTDVLPMIFSALESNSLAIQEAAINVFSDIRPYLDDPSMRTHVLPKAKALFIKSTQVRTRTTAVECIGRLLKDLDKMIVLEEILPFLTDIQCSEAEIIMAIVAIYNQLTDQNVLSHNLLATKIMPSLLPHAVSPALNISQFNDLMAVLHRMLSQIEKDRLNKMKDEAPDAATIELRRRSKSIDMRFAGTSSPSHSPLQQPQQQPSPSNDGATPKASTATLFVNCKDAAGNTGGSSPVHPISNTLHANGLPDPLSPRRRDSINVTPSRRRSSYQGLLRVDERASLKKSSGERRSSLYQAPAPPPGNPHILVSEASVSNFVDIFSSSPTPLRRASTQSVGAVIVAEPGRRDSKGRLVDRVEDANRRSSFQGICEHAMGFFVGKEKIPDAASQ